MKYIISCANSSAEGDLPCKEAKILPAPTNCPTQTFSIEINSLEELTQLTAENGRKIIIQPAAFFPGMEEIVIYNDYIE